MEYAIVSAAPEHLPYLLSIEEAAGELFPMDDQPEPLRSINRPPEDFVKGLNNGLLWVVVDIANISVAFLLASIIDGCIHITEFDVHSDYGKRGIGTKLIDHVLAAAKEKGFPSVTLTTFEHLPWNAPFYRKRGFEVIGVDQIGDELAQIVENEKTLGMRRRVAMIIALTLKKASNGEFDMKIDGVFEVAVKVKNLDVSSKFYQEVLGFTKGHYDEKRRWLFLWVGNNQGMVVLQEDKGSLPQQHLAFTVDKAELNGLKEYLESRNIVVEGPVALDWMNAVSVYFSDPDGHDLEFCALLN